MEMINRPRRLRTSANLRKMVRETRMDKSSLIYPMFIVEGTNIKEEIPSMMGQYRYSVDRMEEKLEQLSKAGIGGAMLFGIPDHKDELGSGAYAQDGIVQQGFRKAKELFPDLYMIGDVCMCEYTSHGHCGVLCGHDVDKSVQSVKFWIKTDISIHRSWHILQNLLLHFTDRSVMQQSPHRHLVTVRRIRWIITTAEKR